MNPGCQDTGVTLDLSLSVSVGLHSTAGLKDENWDSYGTQIPEGKTLATKGIVTVVADGVSAASGGKQAAEICVQGILTDYYSTPESWTVKTSAQRVLTALNRWLYGLTQSEGLADEKGYLSTLSAIIFKSQTAHLFHAGDTRIYRLRGSSLEQLSQDHDVKMPNGVRYLSRAMGLSIDLKIDYQKTDLEKGDLYIISTDGVNDFIPDKDFRQILLESEDYQDLDAVTKAITDLALANGSDDNLTCQIVRIDTLPSSDRNESFRQLSSLPFPRNLTPGVTIDGLLIKRCLAESSRSELFVVQDQENGQQYVLKAPSVNFEDDAAYIERFAMEEWIGRRMEHQSLVRIIKRKTQPSALYYLLEHIQGETLTQWVEKNQSQIDIKEVTQILSEIIAAVRALHRKETIHQDLKPDNILINTDGKVKVIDYGSCLISGIKEISVPFERQDALGTLEFSAPEYRLGTKPTVAADQFSIAVIAYYMLTGGKSPYGKAWERAKYIQGFQKLEYIPSCHHQPLIPIWMDKAMEKALRIHPQSRYDTLSEFFHDLNEPNPEFLQTEYIPLTKRDPLLFWKTISLLLLIALLISLIFR